eukprot:scaffold86281_cov27-Tisochrysis_lutea.AAC.4
MIHGKHSCSRPRCAAARAIAQMSSPPLGASGEASAAAARVSSPRARECTIAHCGEKSRKPKNLAKTQDLAASCASSEAAGTPAEGELGTHSTLFLSRSPSWASFLTNSPSELSADTNP